jgi:predicted HTH transcriptional regulator
MAEPKPRRTRESKKTPAVKESQSVEYKSVWKDDETTVRDFCKLVVEKFRLDKLATSESTETILEKLRMKNGEYFTNAAVLTFGKDIDRWFTGAFVKVGFFETDARINLSR